MGITKRCTRKCFKTIQVIEYHFTPNNIELSYNVIKKLHKNHQIFYQKILPAGIDKSD